MIKPVNGHLIIEPVSHEAFVTSQNETYQEIGVVKAVPDPEFVPDLIPSYCGAGGSGTTTLGGYNKSLPVAIGDKVYFDSWLAAKYPKEGGKDGEFYWLVKWADVRAVEHVV